MFLLPSRLAALPCADTDALHCCMAAMAIANGLIISIFFISPLQSMSVIIVLLPCHLWSPPVDCCFFEYRLCGLLMLLQ